MKVRFLEFKSKLYWVYFRSKYQKLSLFKRWWAILCINWAYLSKKASYAENKVRKLNYILIILTKYRFSDTSSLWTKTYTCVGSGSWVIGMSASIVNSEFSKIYAFNSYSVAGLEYPQFLVLDSATGSSLLSTITFSLICTNIYKMKIYGTKIYSSAE